MTGNSFDGLKPIAHAGQQLEDSLPRISCSYDEFSQPKNLELAFSRLRRDFPKFIDMSVGGAVDSTRARKFLRQLSDDLLARTYRLSEASVFRSVTDANDRPDAIALLRDLIVQAALSGHLESAFLTDDSPCSPEPTEAINWVAAAVSKGFIRIIAADMKGCLGTGRHERLLASVGQHASDPEIFDLLRRFLEAPAQQSRLEAGPLGSLVGKATYEGIDRLLQQARAIAREGAVVHVKCARFGDVLVFLVDADPRYDWLLPAVQKRLREELVEVGCDPGSAQTQQVDLSRGDHVRLLGFDVHCEAGRSVGLRVHFKRVAEEPVGANSDSVPKRRWQWGFHPLAFAGRLLSRLPLPVPRLRGQFIGDAYRAVSSFQFTWQHVPIVLYPVLALFFGWRSPVAAACAVAIPVLNWQSIPAVLAWAWRRRGEVAIGGCAIAALVCLSLFLSDVYAHVSRETSAPNMPSGFLMGRYSPSWGSEPLVYGLYVPPRFRTEGGPFPLIVFLHGANDQFSTRFLRVGLAPSVRRMHESDEGFDSFVLFSIDPTARWAPGSAEVDGALEVLDHVMKRHRIDPSRVYLTGQSSGGMGVLRLAAAYPERWAAIAPLCPVRIGGFKPEKVRQIPCWLFNGDADKLVPVAQARKFVTTLRELGGEVQNTEIPGADHNVWNRAYGSRELFDWFAKHRKQ